MPRSKRGVPRVWALRTRRCMARCTASVVCVWWLYAQICHLLLSVDIFEDNASHSPRTTLPFQNTNPAKRTSRTAYDTTDRSTLMGERTAAIAVVNKNTTTSRQSQQCHSRIHVKAYPQLQARCPAGNGHERRLWTSCHGLSRDSLV